MQLGNDRVKNLRWWLETSLGEYAAGANVTRNMLLNEPVFALRDYDLTRVDILHEYFLPPDRFSDFIKACRQIIPSSYQDLLNVTLRYVAHDAESWLSYAPSSHRIAAVMLFSQEKSQRAEQDMHRMTQELIDHVLALGGSYYLPYRLHARQDQIEKAYPQLRAFISKKRELDPTTLFRNALWDTYMTKIQT